MDFEVGEKVKFKKEHPCGGDKWEIMRVGMDFRVRCLGCGRVMLMPRRKFEKSFKAKVK